MDLCSSEEYRCTRVDACVCVWQELEYRIDVCRLTHGAHIEHIQLSKKKRFSSFPVAVNNSVKVGRLVFLLQIFCNHGEHYETPCIIYVELKKKI
jgi:hypothetical protein